MNRVQTVAQKHHRVENQVKKPNRVHEHPAGPAGTPRCALARPGAHWRAQARACLAVSWAGLAVSWPRPPAVSQPKAAMSQAPQRRIIACDARAPARYALRAMPAPLRASSARPAHLLRAQCLIVGAVPRAPAPCRGRVCA